MSLREALSSSDAEDRVAMENLRELEAFCARNLPLDAESELAIARALSRTHVMKCGHCGDEHLFGHGSRRNARAQYCSDRCRVAASRARAAHKENYPDPATWPPIVDNPELEPFAARFRAVG